MSATRRSRPRSWMASTSMPSIPSVPLISASPSLAISVTGSMPASPSACAAAHRRAARVGDLALADQHERAVRERREVAARAERAVLRHDRGDPGVEQREHRLGQQRPRAGAAHRRACARAAASSPARPRARPAGPCRRRASARARAAAPRGARPGSRRWRASRSRSRRRRPAPRGRPAARPPPRSPPSRAAPRPRASRARRRGPRRRRPRSSVRCRSARSREQDCIQGARRRPGPLSWKPSLP